MTAALLRDPRHYQIAVLASLLAWGLVGLDLEVRPAVAATIVATALAAQWMGGRVVNLPRFEPRSALISALSLTLLLRTTSPAVAALAAALTIGGKFVIRLPRPGGTRYPVSGIRSRTESVDAPPQRGARLRHTQRYVAGSATLLGWMRRRSNTTVFRERGTKHVFNPTNFGLAAVLLLTDRAWVSPGQWGSAALAAFALACAGLLVVRRAERSDVTWAFLAFYAAVLFGRALWLGDPLAIPLHQLSNGAFLVFAFFMISDPKTTPDSRAGRVLFALLVALGAGFVHFVLFRPNGLIWSLAALAPLVPVIDRLLPGRRYRWPEARPAGASETRSTPGLEAPAPPRHPVPTFVTERSRP